MLSIAVAGFLAEAQFGLFGSLRNDAVFAVAFLASLVLLLPRHGGAPGWKNLALAGGLLGLCIGVKLTNGVYALFFAAAALIILPDWRSRFTGALICGVFALAGLLIFGGGWALYLYQTYGNPIFPLLNGLFDAPLGPTEAFRDTRYLPHGPIDVVLRPFLFLFDGELINEHDFFDPRLQLGYLAGAGILVSGAVSTRIRSAPGFRVAAGLSAGLIFMLFGWALVFSIARYVMGAWMIGPLLVTALLALWRPGLLSGGRASLTALAMAVALCLITQPSLLRRAPWPSDWSAPYVTATIPAGQTYENSVIAFAGGYPGAFLSPYFPPSARLTHLVPQDWSAPALGNYRAQIRTLVRDPSTDLHVVIVETAEGYFQETLRRLDEIENVTVDVPACQRIRSSMDTPSVHWEICPATYAGSN